MNDKYFLREIAGLESLLSRTALEFLAVSKAAILAKEEMGRYKRYRLADRACREDFPMRLPGIDSLLSQISLGWNSVAGNCIPSLAETLFAESAHERQAMGSLALEMETYAAGFDGIYSADKIGESLKSMLGRTAAASLMRDVSGTSIARDAIAGLDGFSSMDQVLRSFDSNEKLQAAVEALRGMSFSEDDLPWVEIEQSQIEALSEHVSLEEFKNRLQALPGQARKALYVFFLAVQLLAGIATITGYSYKSITELIQSADLHSAKTEREKANLIASLSTEKAHTQGLRFISSSAVHLRQNPNTRSPILDRLELGQVLVVLDKSNRSWLEVTYIDQKTGEPMQGWVFRRYTHRFH